MSTPMTDIPKFSIPQEQFTKAGGTLLLKYHVGRPSWHQMRAGHSSAGSLTVRHTHAEHLTYLNNCAYRDDLVTWTVLSPVKIHA